MYLGQLRFGLDVQVQVQVQVQLRRDGYPITI